MDLDQVGVGIIYVILAQVKSYFMLLRWQLFNLKVKVPNGFFRVYILTILLASPCILLVKSLPRVTRECATRA